MKKQNPEMVPGNLVRLSAGQYLRVKTKLISDSPFVELGDETNAVLVEHQGHDHKHELECWSVLVNDHLLLAWQDQFTITGR